MAEDLHTARRSLSKVAGDFYPAHWAEILGAATVRLILEDYYIQGRRAAANHSAAPAPVKAEGERARLARALTIADDVLLGTATRLAEYGKPHAEINAAREIIKAALSPLPEPAGEPAIVTAMKGLMDEWHRQAAAYDKDGHKDEIARAYSALLDRVASDLKLTISSVVHAHPAPANADPAAEGMSLHPAAAYLLKDAERGSWGFIHNGRQARLVAHYVDGPASPPSAAEEA